MRRLTKHGTFTEFTELRKNPISTEMSVVLLTKHGTLIMELRKIPISTEMSVVLLTKHGNFITELRKIPISTEMSVVLLTKHGTLIYLYKPRTGHGNRPIPERIPDLSVYS